MADWTANSGFGATRDRGTVRRTEPVLRPVREGGQPPRADRLAASRDWEEPAPAAAEPRLSPGAAALAQYNAALEGPLAKARLAVWAGGGALSLLLIAGVGVWGYKLVLREVMGLPVIAAEGGPMRVAPADPGGEVVPQQGFAVNAIPAAGTAAPPSDVLMLAPQAPGLAEEDMQVVQTNAEEGEVMPVVSAVATDPLALVEQGAEPSAGPAPEVVLAEAAPTAPVALPPAAAPEATATPAPAQAAPAVAAAATTLDPAADQAQQAARLVAALLPADRAMTPKEILAFADQVAAGAQPLAPLAPAATTPAASPADAAVSAPAPAEPAVATLVPPAATDTTAALAVPASAAVPAIPATVPGPTAAPVPPARPATLRLASAAPAPATPTAAVPAPAEAAPEAPAAPAPAVAPSAVPSGTHLVQLGAFDSAEIAASEWARLRAAHPEFLGSRDHVIQETQSGGATLYRLRTLGFPERADARILCAALTAEGTDCIPVTVD